MKSICQMVSPLFLAAVALCALAGFQAGARVDGVSSNRPPRLVVTVLPFENATGDAALDDWRQALHILVQSCVGLAELTSVPEWKKFEPSLTRAGWTDAKVVDLELAHQVARELKASTAVWGSFRRQTNPWTLEATLLRAEPVAIAALGFGSRGGFRGFFDRTRAVREGGREIPRGCSLIWQQLKAPPQSESPGGVTRSCLRRQRRVEQSKIIVDSWLEARQPDCSSLQVPPSVEHVRSGEVLKRNADA